MDNSTFVTNELIPGILEARRLRSVIDDEAEPYKSKYAAADLLESLQQKAAALNQTSDVNAARCKLERGLVLMDTDLMSQGQQCLEESLEYPWSDSADAWAIQLEAHNALAALHCDREEFAVSLEHLNAARELYHKIHALQQGSALISSSNAADSGAAAGIDKTPSCRPEHGLERAQDAEAHYTTTLYYLAQVHGHAGDKQLSAAYCAATLNRQLKLGTFDINDWVQNCVQLSGYFLDCNAFALSQYCFAAVEKVVLQWHDSHSQHAACQATAAGTADLHNGSDQEQHRPALSKRSITEQQQQHSCHRDQTVKQQQQQQQQQQNPEAGGGANASWLGPALLQLDDDVAANVQLAFGKLHLYRLVASHERYVEGKELQYGFVSSSDVPTVVCFDALPGLPELSSLSWGDAALAADAGSALAVFKAALPWFRAALGFYKLDGWVTQHCQTLFEMSNLYRCLAGFEPDVHKRCVMHRQRAKLLQPLEGQLNPCHYPGLARSISLELGNIFREIGDIKAGAGREEDKVAAALLAAAQHYQLFMDSFKGPDGELPNKVEPEMEQHYLSGAFSLARVLQALPETDQTPHRATTLLRSVHILELLVKYVRDNSVGSWQQEADLAQEMAELLREKVVLVQHFHRN